MATADLKDELVARTRELREDIARVPEQLRDLILGEFEVNGAVPVNQANIQAMMDALQRNLLQQIQNAGGNGGGGGHAPAAPQPPVLWQRWYHPARGKWSRVPPDFIFPKLLTVKPCWDLYLHGNRAASIRPFRSLECDDLPNRSDRCRLSAMRAVCRFIIEHVDENQNVLDMAEGVADQAFANAWPRAEDKLGDTPARRAKLRGDLMYMTLYKIIRDFKADVNRVLGEDDEEQEDEE